MEVQVWTLIGLLAATLAGMIWTVIGRIDGLGVEHRNQGREMNARFDALGARIDGRGTRIDGLTKDLHTQGWELSDQIYGLAQRLDRRHAG